MELSNSQIEEDKINDLIDSLCQRAGVEDKGDLSFNDFSHMLKDYKHELNYAVLNVKIEGIYLWL